MLFPHVATVTAIHSAPDVTPYRFFLDIPISIINLIPSAIFGFTKIQTVAEINTILVNSGAPIPVDLVGFGYYSLGTAGVIMWVFLYGWLSGKLDSLFTDSAGRWSIVRAFLAVTFGLRVAYCEPTHVVLSSFHMFIILAILLPVLWMRPRAARKSGSPRRDSALPHAAHAG
jgi:hypothetical protein